MTPKEATQFTTEHSRFELTALRHSRAHVPFIFASFWNNLFGVDFDVSSKLEVSRFEIVDADTQARFAYCLNC